MDSRKKIFDRKRQNVRNSKYIHRKCFREKYYNDNLNSKCNLWVPYIKHISKWKDIFCERNSNIIEIVRTFYIFFYNKLCIMAYLCIRQGH